MILERFFIFFLKSMPSQRKQTSNSDGFSFKEPEESTGFLMWQVSMLWQRRINAALSDLHLTHGQFVVLAATAWLTRSGASATQTDIANHAKIDKMMMSTLVRSLEEKALVRRLEHETDTRAKKVELTKEGKLLVKKAVKRVESADDTFFDLLGPQAPAFARALLKLLREETA